MTRRRAWTVSAVAVMCAASASWLAWRHADWYTSTGAPPRAATLEHPTTLIAPASGVQWRAGSVHEIRWAPNAALTTIQLQFSLDNGATWEPIATVAANAGAHSWTVPDVGNRLVHLRAVDGAGGMLAPITSIVVLSTSSLWQLVTEHAPWSPRDGVGAFVFNDRMWMEGGWHWDVKTYPNVGREMWSSTDGADWRFHGLSPWSGTHVCGCVVFNDKMWIVGGNSYPDVWSTPDGVTWTQVLKQGPWGRRYKPYVVVHDKRLWLMGGFALENDTYRPYNDVWSSPDGLRWTRVLDQAPWQPRGATHGQVVFDGKIWVIGGGQYVQPTDPLEHYFADVWTTTNGVDWTQVTARAPWSGRIHHNIAVYADRLWVMGGHNGMDVQGGHVRLQNDVWVSSDGVNWIELPGTPWTARHAAATYAFRDDLYVLAGFLVNDVWKLRLAGALEINNGDTATATRTVMLSLAPPAPDVEAMQFSNDGVTWSAPEAYARQKQWTLAEGPGGKRVYVRFQKPGSAWTQAFSDGITYGGA